MNIEAGVYVYMCYVCLSTRKPLNVQFNARKTMIYIYIYTYIYIHIYIIMYVLCICILYIYIYML